MTIPNSRETNYVICAFLSWPTFHCSLIKTDPMPIWSTDHHTTF